MIHDAYYDKKKEKRKKRKLSLSNTTTFFIVFLTTNIGSAVFYCGLTDVIHNSCIHNNITAF